MEKPDSDSRLWLDDQSRAFTAHARNPLRSHPYDAGYRPNGCTLHQVGVQTNGKSLGGASAPRHGEFEFLLEVDVIRAQQEPQGQPAYLGVNTKRENSMLVKRWRSENVKGRVAQDPGGMVKPRLVESQMPSCQSHRSDTALGLFDNYRVWPRSKVVPAR